MLKPKVDSNEELWTPSCVNCGRLLVLLLNNLEVMRCLLAAGDDTHKADCEGIAPTLAASAEAAALKQEEQLLAGLLWMLPRGWVAHALCPYSKASAASPRDQVSFGGWRVPTP